MSNSFKRFVIAFAATVAMAASAGSALAQVRYDFTAFSSFASNGEQFSGSFSVELPGFVTVNTTVPVASLLSCSVVASPAASASCRDQDFLLDIVPTTGETTISFGVKTDLNPGTGIFYYFDATAFSTPGTHDTVFFGTDQAGRLVVTAVPEPETYAMMLLGLGVMGAIARRRKAKQMA